MLDIKERPQTVSESRASAGVHEVADRGRSEMVVVIGLVAVVSMAFGFVLGLLF